jgi:hypothetical protein
VALLQSGCALPAQGHGPGKTYLSTGRKATYRDRNAVAGNRATSIYGYARVSTDGQSVEAQVRQLAKAGCSKVFREVASGAKTDRAQLRKALDWLEAGDVLMVTRLDRLARSTRDLLNTLAAIAGKKAGFRSLGYAWADTPSSSASSSARAPARSRNRPWRSGRQ